MVFMLQYHSLVYRLANIAQLVEQRFRKPQVKGSSPFIGSSEV